MRLELTPKKGALPWPECLARHADMKKLLFALVALSLSPQHAIANNVGVTSSADPRVTDAGMEMLRQGGSAADAAMAMMLALTVVEPQSSGIGGGGFLLYQDSSKGVLSTINGRETAPSAATPDRFVGPDGKPLGFLAAFQGGRSVGVPGNVSLMAETHSAALVQFRRGAQPVLGGRQASRAGRKIQKPEAGGDFKADREKRP
jgi:Gamma-glutamyltranspeptidase